MTFGFIAKYNIIIHEYLSPIIYIFFTANMSCTLDNRFSCDNKHCIPMYQRCDGVDNCGDGSDENDLSVCGMMHNIRQCDHYTEFTCANRECVNKSKLCNLQYDCEDLSDEKGCRKLINAVGL